MNGIKLFAVFLVGAAGVATAQCWSGSGPVTTTCNVGIGVSPQGALDIWALGGNGWVYLRGNTGTTPSTNVDYGLIVGWNASGYQGETKVLYGAGMGSAPRLDFGRWTGASMTTGMSLSNGNVGIGTTDPGNKLSVAGTIQAYEVLVNTGWSDYVFGPAYKLRPLSEVSKYIRENHHLPEIPSAQEVQEKGVSLGEMQSKLLAKIEELTLHMIQSEKENRQLRERIDRLEAEGGHAPTN